jgi:hypothetical protein
MQQSEVSLAVMSFRGIFIYMGTLAKNKLKVPQKKKTDNSSQSWASFGVFFYTSFF